MNDQEFMNNVNASRDVIYKACNMYCKGIDYSDVVQDIYLHAWSSVGGFRKESSFKTWLWRIARNTCVSNFRARRKQPPIEELKDYEEIIGNSNNYSEIVSQLREAIKYETVMNTLDDADRSIFELYLFGSSYKEMQQQTGINENALRVKIHRIEQRLRLRYGNRSIK
jgi:RNA polymerase sigma-70 factor, ECF subfamily